MPSRPGEHPEPREPLEPNLTEKDDTLQPDPGVTPRLSEPSQPALPTPPALLPQSERYEVQALIGTGGMGKVYKAFDRKLKRAVALKFLNGADATLERRFLQEAQSQARIDHAHVCKVYEVGRVGEDPYIAMQFIDGQTLREAAKEMTVAQRVSVLRDVALAVHAAHKLGLIHRDIKPANILVERTDGTPKPFICDFGLARDLAEPGNTVQGALLGTPQYMAPEQARGEQDKLDARTDVYGLGATLYDALAGKPPFEGASNLQTLYRMMHEEPPPLQRQDPTLPRDLCSVVMKCLEKDPAQRYDSARALAEDLQHTLDGEPVRARPVGRVGRAVRVVRRNKALAAALLALALAVIAPATLGLLDIGGHVTVAVADFDNQTGDRGLDGLSGMLITSLEQSKRLSVLTRSRMFDVLRQIGRPDVARIDEALGREVAQKSAAQALVLGTIRKFDNLFVIDLKILDPRSNEYVAALKEEGEGLTSVPKLIDRLSARARKSLRESEVQSAPVEEVTTRSLDAYGHYFTGEQLIDRLQFSRAAEEYRKGVAIDPKFALAWYRLAYAQMWLHDGKSAREAIDKAFTLESRLPQKELLLARGVRASLYNRGNEAYDIYKSCEGRFPGEKECAFMVGDTMFHGGYASWAIDHFRKALVLDPAMERAHQHLLWAYQLLGKGDELLAAGREYVARVGNDAAYGHLGRVQLTRGDTSAARATFERAHELFPNSVLPAVDLGTLDAWGFDVDAAVARLSPVASGDRAPGDRAVARLALGGALVQGGRIREALQAFIGAAEDARASHDGEREAVALSHAAFLHFLYLHDPDGARRIAQDAVARGVPETMFAFLYPLMGDLERYGAVLRGIGDPLADKSVAVFDARKRGDYAKAAEGIESLADKSPYQDFLFYVLADTWAQAHDDARAVDRLRHAQALAPGVTVPGLQFAGLFRARSDYELGVLYERLGQPALAASSTERFLKAWAKADEELPEVNDARLRLARLRQSGHIELR